MKCQDVLTVFAWIMCGSQKWIGPDLDIPIALNTNLQHRQLSRLLFSKEWFNQTNLYFNITVSVGTKGEDRLYS
jgi:hypothetical protein